MPNWTQNSITIEGDAFALQQITDVAFNFHRLHPCPFIHDENYDEGWYDWCCKHWGTKWSPEEPDLDYVEGDASLSATFQTAWNAPHALLTYLTIIHPSLTITNEWDNENYEIVGITTYAHGTMTTQMIDPSEYTLESLEQFAIDNLWFSYNHYAAYVEEMENYEEGEKQDQIIVQHRQHNYDELIA
jgi:hypothetical protein